MQKKPTIPAPKKADVSHSFGSQHHTVVHQQKTVQTIFDPDVLLKYQAMVPDAAQRILLVFEQNSAAERKVVDDALAAQKADNMRRDWMAFLIIMMGMGISALFAFLGKEWLSGGALAAIIGYAVIGYLQKHKKPSS